GAERFDGGRGRRGVRGGRGGGGGRDGGVRRGRGIGGAGGEQGARRQEGGAAAEGTTQGVGGGHGLPFGWSGGRPERGRQIGAAVRPISGRSCAAGQAVGERVGSAGAGRSVTRLCHVLQVRQG